MTQKDNPPSFPEPEPVPDTSDPGWMQPKPGEDVNPPSGDPHRRDN
jgi:hypothetical protein